MMIVFLGQTLQPWRTQSFAFGNPAAVSPVVRRFRPVVLRPTLSDGLPFRAVRFELIDESPSKNTAKIKDDTEYFTTY
jgi:hypothetical protein